METILGNSEGFWAGVLVASSYFFVFVYRVFVALEFGLPDGLGYEEPCKIVMPINNNQVIIFNLMEWILFFFFNIP